MRCDTVVTLYVYVIMSLYKVFTLRQFSRRIYRPRCYPESSNSNYLCYGMFSTQRLVNLKSSTYHDIKISLGNKRSVSSKKKYFHPIMIVISRIDNHSSKLHLIIHNQWIIPLCYIIFMNCNHYCFLQK